MALLPVQENVGGLSPAFSVPEADGDTFANDGSAVLMIQNAAPITLTVHSPHPGRVDYVESMAAGIWIFPRFDPVWWNDRDGFARFSVDDTDDVIVAVFRTGVIVHDPGASPLPGLF